MRAYALAVVLLLATAGAVVYLSVPRTEPTRSVVENPVSTPVMRPANPSPAPVPNHDGMVLIPAGTFWMGDDKSQSDAHPMHQVTLDAFWMDQNTVTNEQFEAFVKATGYVTTAEQKPDPKDFPGAAPEDLVPGAAVFTPPPAEDGDVPLDSPLRWWRYIPGANWRHPEGPQSDLKGREKHPVVQVSWYDAAAYAKWAGKRLPTEAEFEYAARGGLDRKLYCWGDDLTPSGKWQANIWQGKFPTENLGTDGFRGTSPVGSFPANGYGLYDMSGNVWQWCADWYTPDYYEHSAIKNPTGPEDSFDPEEPGAKKKVVRGGSYLCNDCYCKGYRPASRMKNTPDTGLNHTGFRCVQSDK